MFVTGCLPPQARHSLVWLANGPTIAPFADHWNRGLPFVLCRPRDGEEISLGICLPPAPGSKPSRHALAVQMADVGMLARPPLLREVAARLPLLNPLLPLVTNPRVIGSGMWEFLTHEKFLTQTSDIDMVWDLGVGENPAHAVEFFHRADAFPMRIDGEISFPGVGEVAWREWASSSKTVLVKSMNDVTIMQRETLLEAQTARSKPGRSPLADAAVDALVEELELYPKPGLVSRHDSGSHTDMDHAIMRKSAASLHEFFTEIENNPGDFEDCLKPIGMRAERQMLHVTGGINTHRGAIFLLGLLIAAASRTSERNPAAIRESLFAHYGQALRGHDKAMERANTHGARARKVHGSSGARGEASRGFPIIFEVALPNFRRLCADGDCRQAASLETLMLLISRVDDSNLVHRGGASGASQARKAALRFLGDGGVRNPAWFQNLQFLHSGFVSDRLSPGGCADLLAAVFFLDRVARCSPLRSTA